MKSGIGQTAKLITAKAKIGQPHELEIVEARILRVERRKVEPCILASAE